MRKFAINNNWGLVPITLAMGVSAACSETAFAAYAPPEPGKTENLISVTGQRQSREELRRQASAFVIGATSVPEEGQYARRTAPLCPVISGIDDRYGALVDAKIRAIASAVGAKLAPLGCRANLFVSFSKDSDSFINGLKKRQPALFSGLQPAAIKSLLANTAPIKWMHAKRGDGIDGDQTDGRVTNFANQRIGSLSFGSATLNTYSASLIKTPLAVSITGTIVAIDIERSSGYTLDSIAAYTAMISLAQIRTDGDYSSYPSVLAMFSANKARDEAPSDLTEWDYAYMRALYKVQLNRTARVQRAKIAGEMLNQLVK
jgi:hypothetical protein